MNNVVVLDACTIVNLARIDEGDFLEDRVRTRRVFAIEEVLDEVKKHYVPSDKASKRQLHVAPYWGGLTKLENKDVEELLEPVRALSNYSVYILVGWRKKKFFSIPTIIPLSRISDTVLSISRWDT